MSGYGKVWEGVRGGGGRCGEAWGSVKKCVRVWGRMGKIGQSFSIFLEPSQKVPVDYRVRNQNVKILLKNNDVLRSDSAFLWQPMLIFFLKCY